MLVLGCFEGFILGVLRGQRGALGAGVYELGSNLGMGRGDRACSRAIPTHDDETVMNGAPGFVHGPP